MEISRRSSALSDTGLLVAQLDRESQEDVRVRRDLGTWKGGFFENVVSEALVKNECPLAYYKKEGSTLEKTMISGASYKDISWGVKFVRGNVGWMSRVLTIPQWSAFLLPKILEFYPKT